ncbi:MAG TPA: protein phosphatase 2C domain-containing protein [Chroococcidiopsis sp.]
MNSQFEFAAGSVMGRSHGRLGKNNQDAYHVAITDQFAIAVVCDGCGSSPHSEVGATLGARLVAEVIAEALAGAIAEPSSGAIAEPISGEIAEAITELQLDQTFWQGVQHALLNRLDGWRGQFGGDRAAVVRDYLLFTVVVAVITPTVTVLAAAGDGVVILNGDVQRLSAADNAPRYLAYGLLPEVDPAAFGFTVCYDLPTSCVESLLIGSDGVGDLIDAAAQPMPGRAEVVGAIAQFWQGDRYFHNPDQVRRRLSLINREAIQPDWSRQVMVRQAGLLSDDTTLVVARRKPND